MSFNSRIRWVPLIAMIAAVALGISLGNWQSRRAAEKDAIEQKLLARAAQPPLDLTAVAPDAGQAEYRPVKAKGRFVSEWPIYLDNRPYQGRAGFYLMMPMRLSGADRAVLVARGWVARDVADRTKLPDIPVPAGEVEIEGVARREAARLLQLGEAPPLRPGAIVQNAPIAQLAQASGLQLAPFLIEQTSALDDGLVRDWPRPSFGADKHRGYAFQWYGLAAAAFIFFVVTGIRRGPRQ